VPAVSVIMPVYNARPYLEQSVGSILAQSFGDVEFLILENGSTDGSGALLHTMAEREPRIRLFQSPRPLGSAGSSNLLASHARAAVIARMDADDVSHPHRLERQLEVLERHPEAVLVGTLFEGIDQAGRRVQPRDRSKLMRQSAAYPFPHGAIAFRREAFERVGGYREEREGWEDLDLIRRLAEVGQVLVLPGALYAFRFHRRSMTARTEVQPAMEGAAASEIEALYLREASRLWSGERPALLGELVARRLVRRLGRRAWLLAWAGWARLSPGSLRLMLRTWIRARDRAAGRRLPDGEPVEWQFGRA
jgi:glycosyltransferase involved in cell wall biosynthesis